MAFYHKTTPVSSSEMLWDNSDFTQRLLRLHLGYDRNLKGHFGLTYSSLWLREP